MVFINSEHTKSNVVIITSLLILSFFITSLNINIGFALKPFMIVSMVSFLFLRKKKYSKMQFFEFFMFLFFLIFSMTALQFRFSEAHLRFIFALILILGFYFINRSIVIKLPTHRFERIFSKMGLFGIVISCLYYLLGMAALDFNYIGNNITSFGVLVDRSIPRLTGLISSDPNITAFVITPYFFYTASNLNNLSNKVGFILSSLAILLTFSRGAYVAIAIAFLFLIVFSNKRVRLNAVVIISIISFLTVILGNIFKFNPIEFISTRFQAIIFDGGSGRDVLWDIAYQTFLNHPFFGIGIHSTLQYGTIYYDNSHYSHNTFLEVLVESGVFGFVFYMLFWLAVFKQSIKLYRLDSKSKFILLSLISMFFQMMFLSVLYNEMFYFLLLILFKYSYDQISMKEQKKLR